MKSTEFQVDKNHRGEVVSNVVRSIKVNGARITQNWLAEKLGISRRTLINWFENPKLPVEKIREIGRAIKHDFSAEFPDLRSELVWTLAEEAALLETPDVKAMLDRARLDRDRYKDQYINLLEKYNALQEEYYKLKLDK